MSAKRSLLIVEDDPQLLQFFRSAMTILGFDVRVASDGLQALRRLEASLPDVVVLDLGLPTLSGWSVLMDLASDPHTRDVPVIVVTGSDVHPRQDNVFCVLQKPVTPDRLHEAIERCLGRRHSAL